MNRIVRDREISTFLKFKLETQLFHSSPTFCNFKPILASAIQHTLSIHLSPDPTPRDSPRSSRRQAEDRSQQRERRVSESGRARRGGKRAADKTSWVVQVRLSTPPVFIRRSPFTLWERDCNCSFNPPSARTRERLSVDEGEVMDTEAA